jgi:acetoacetyl-CoA synthetase
VPDVLWEPSADVVERARITEFTRWLGSERGLQLDDYASLWEWSVGDLDGFWSAVWEHHGLLGSLGSATVLGRREMPGAEWFPDARLNWAENVLERAPDGVAVVARSRTRGGEELTGPQLRARVASVATGLRQLGVGSGDRVAAYLPNIPEAVVLLLACAAVGAVFSSCPPEFGVKGVVDRVGQIDPVLLVAIDGYRHRGRAIDRRAEVEAIRDALPTLRATVLLGYLDPGTDAGTSLPGALAWSDLEVAADPLQFEALAFAHPLYILYTSGTTGRPKPIVHGHGGILLEHTKLHHLHHDLGPADRFFWYSTTGWMMWNYLVSGLLTGASIVLYDGDAADPDVDALWSLAEETAVTLFGVSAPFLLSCRRAGIEPGATHDLTHIRQVGSTGAPLPPEGARWVYERVHPDLFLVSASGGTDVCTAFVAGAPVLPVVAGEMACRCLGADVHAFDPDGRSLIGEEGELVVTQPMPSMPVGLWGDSDGSRYRGAYFDRFPGVWAHGDWITITDRGTCRITGRSDATLNRGGVRLGTSDFYSVVEDLPEVADSLVVHLEDPEGGVGELLLFVVPAAGSSVDDDLRARIVAELRTKLSPRHAPDEILGVPVVPRTLSGKKLEIPVKRIVLGVAADVAASRESLADPTSLEPYVELASRRRAARAGGERA